MTMTARIAAVLLVPVLAGSCSEARNVAASLMPAYNQDYDATALKSGRYTLDREHAALLFSFDHMGYSTLIVRLERFDATLDFDREHPAAAALSVTIDPASVNSSAPRLDQELKGKDFFAVEKYPEAGFTADRVVFTGATTADVPGQLTFHGATREVILHVTFNGGSKNWVSGQYTLGFSASAEIKRSEFGVDNLLALTGDDVTVTIEAEFALVEE